MRATRTSPAFAAALAAALALPGCARPPVMCTSPGECGASSSCVAGRCVARDAVLAISTARRVVVAPVDVGYVSADEGATGSIGAGGAPAIAVLGRAGGAGGGGGAKILLRFALPLAPDAVVLEAYLLVDRVADVDADPVPIVVHAEATVEPWGSRSLSWARQPRLEDVTSPLTRVLPAGASLVRLDVRGLVERWRRRGKDDLGVAIVAGADTGARAASVTGVAFALDPRDAPTRTMPHHQAEGPRLELYVKR